MQLDTYSYDTNNANFDYEFESSGPNGIIRKVVRLTPIGINLFNLGFGDLDITTGEISDLTVTNNDDTGKVLATVAAIANEFTNTYPDAAIFIQGTTLARNRLYQINIAKYWELIKKSFEVEGLKNKKWETFRKDVRYDAFLARRSDNIL